jgi:ABC-type amino acid transport substrate-binding protein
MALLVFLSLVAPSHAQDEIHMGFLYSTRPELNRSDTRAAFDLWTQEFMAKQKIVFKVEFYDDVEKMRADFMSRKINIVAADPMSLARYFRQEAMQDGFATSMIGGFDLILASSGQGPVKTLSDLDGKRIAVYGNDPITETFLETLCLKQFRRPCSRVFSHIETVQNGNQALMNAFFGKVDVALVYRFRYELSSEMNPQIRQRLSTILAEYPLPGMFYGLASADIDKTTLDRALNSLINMRESPRGRMIMELFKIDHLRRVKPTDLKPFVQLDQEYQALKARYVLKSSK